MELRLFSGGSMLGGSVAFVCVFLHVVCYQTLQKQDLVNWHVKDRPK